MCPNSSEPARSHLAAIERLTDHLLATCADRFGIELEDRLKELRCTFDALLQSNPGPTDVHDGLQQPHLEHNYVSEICSALLVFAHEVSLLNARHGVKLLDDPLRRLWDELGRRYRTFFAEPPPYAT